MALKRKANLKGENEPKKAGNCKKNLASYNLKYRQIKRKSKLSKHKISE